MHLRRRRLHSVVTDTPYVPPAAPHEWADYFPSSKLAELWEVPEGIIIQYFISLPSVLRSTLTTPTGAESISLLVPKPLAHAKRRKLRALLLAAAGGAA